MSNDENLLLTSESFVPQVEDVIKTYNTIKRPTNKVATFITDYDPSMDKIYVYLGTELFRVGKDFKFSDDYKYIIAPNNKQWCVDYKEITFRFFVFKMTIPTQILIVGDK